MWIGMQRGRLWVCGHTESTNGRRKSKIGSVEGRRIVGSGANSGAMNRRESRDFVAWKTRMVMALVEGTTCSAESKLELV